MCFVIDTGLLLNEKRYCSVWGWIWSVGEKPDQVRDM